MCVALAVSRSGYYVLRGCLLTVQAAENHYLLPLLRDLYQQTREDEGALKF